MLTRLDVKRAIVGMALGDGYIDKSGGLLIAHGPKQEGYAEAKRRIISERFYTSELKRVTRNSTFGEQHIVRFRAALGKYGKQLRHKLYRDGVKIAPISLLKFMGRPGMLFLFLDDGTLSITVRSPYRVSREAYLSKESLDDQSRRNIKRFLLEELEIRSKDAPYRKRGRLYTRIRIPAASMRTLLTELQALPYKAAMQAMRYKLCPKYAVNRQHASKSLISLNQCRNSCITLFDGSNKCRCRYSS